MQLEVGKFYRDDKGIVWGPLKPCGRENFCVGGQGYQWKSDGTEITYVRPLVAEAADPRTKIGASA